MIKNLECVFTKYRDRRWFFLKPGGNWGDYLIYAGAEALAERCGLKWIDITIDDFKITDFRENDCIYLHGSGGFNSWCSGQPFFDLRSALGQRVELVVQGPATVEEDESFLKVEFDGLLPDKSCSNFIFFAREWVSFNIMKGILDDSIEIQLMLDKDTALHLTSQNILTLAKEKNDVLENSRYRLKVVRNDPESSGSYLRRDFFAVHMDPAYYARSFEQWLRIHIYAKSVATDRLHSAIVSAILGKKVILFNGSYHKNKSIYDFSLERLGVSFCEQSFLKASEKNINLNLFLASYKFNKIRNFFARVPS